MFRSVLAYRAHPGGFEQVIFFQPNATHRTIARTKLDHTRLVFVIHSARSQALQRTNKMLQVMALHQLCTGAGGGTRRKIPAGIKLGRDRLRMVGQNEETEASFCTIQFIFKRFVAPLRP